MTITTATRPASPKQVALIERLYAERDFDLTPFAGYERDVRRASAAIDALFAAPRRASADRPAPGFYVHDGAIVKVQPNQAGTNTYAKRLVPSGTAKRGSWEYVPGLIDRLAGATPATAADMAAYGHETGTCGICGALLTDPASIERGIGPVCAKRF